MRNAVREVNADSMMASGSSHGERPVNDAMPHS
jgi:hypothetical protein